MCIPLIWVETATCHTAFLLWATMVHLLEATVGFFPTNNLVSYPARSKTETNINKA